MNDNLKYYQIMKNIFNLSQNRAIELLTIVSMQLQMNENGHSGDETVKTRLSKRAGKVLFGICAYPNASNMTLSRHLSINCSTVSTIKKRLKDSGCIMEWGVPIYPRMSQGITAITLGNYRFIHPNELRQSIMSMAFSNSKPYFSLMNESNWFSLNAARDFSTIPMANSTIAKFCKDFSFNTKQWTTHNDENEIYRFFDFAPFLKHHLNLDELVLNNRNKYPYWTPDLTEKEIMVLKSIISNPGISDYQRSMSIPLSHPTCKRIREDLAERGVIKETCQPNFKVLGVEQIGFIRIEMNVDEVPASNLNSIMSIPNIFFAMKSSDSIILIYLLTTVNESANLKNQILEKVPNHLFSYEKITHGIFYLDNKDINVKYEFPGTFTHVFNLPEEMPSITSINENLRRILSPHLHQKEFNELVSRLYPDKKQVEKRISANDLHSIIVDIMTDSSKLNCLPRGCIDITRRALLEELNRLQNMSDVQKGENSAPEKKGLLLVTQNEPHARTFFQILTENGFTVHLENRMNRTAYKRYLELSENNDEPVVVVIDIGMDPNEAIEFAAALKEGRKGKKKHPVIVLSPTYKADVKHRFQALGVDGFLVKPISKRGLLESIGAVINVPKGRC